MKNIIISLIVAVLIVGFAAGFAAYEYKAEMVLVSEYSAQITSTDIVYVKNYGDKCKVAITCQDYPDATGVYTVSEVEYAELSGDADGIIPVYVYAKVYPGKALEESERIVQINKPIV